MHCCCSSAYGAVFDERQARRDARRYRKRGLDRTARRMLAHLRGHGVEGATVLEVGGGVGAIQIELLRAGAARTTNVELSPAYESEAGMLLDEVALGDRVERRVADFTAAADSIPPTDVVLLHRVVCCYPDAAALVEAAAGRARRRLVISYPPANLFSRLAVAAINLCCAARRIDFRAFIHSPRVISEAASAGGLQSVFDRRSGIWRLAGFERPSEASG